ncbi:hypothetical protein GQ600_24638 [Phytophthora cactorum]|nr:hypothetical protein GQ600_24638 [Phytophthora cactorum]
MCCVSAPPFQEEENTWYKDVPVKEIPLVQIKDLRTSASTLVLTDGLRVRGRPTSARRTTFMLAQVPRKDDGSWGIAVKREVYHHNHQRFTSTSQVSTQPPLVPGVELLMQGQAGTASIYEYIRENSDHRMTMTDVRNLIDRLCKLGKDLHFATPFSR